MQSQRSQKHDDELLGEKVLDNPIWTSLIGDHREFALGQLVGQGKARRYPPAIGFFAGMQDRSSDAFDDLSRLVSSGEPIAVLFDEDPVLPATWRLLRSLPLVQMIQREDAPDQSRNPAIVRLLSVDRPEMVALAKLTEPGPFSDETARLGEFYGIRMGEQLVAMAGQRFKPQGFVEVSAVCTHPAYRGRGLAAQLVSWVVAQIRSGGSVPFLTCMRENTGAIRLYESLGFSYRRSFVLGVLERS